MASRQATKYGVAAAALALAIIAVAVVATPYLGNNTGTKTSNGSSQQASQQAGNFLVLLTDPPTVPAGTTQLNVTYSSISIQVKYPNGSAATVPVTASGTVDLLTLVNVSQTIGSTNIPAGSTVTSIQFTLSSATAMVNGKTYPVTLLSSNLVVPIKGGQVLNQTKSAALLDLHPTLVEVDATNSTGGAVTYYVLVPSATAIVKSSVSKGQESVGAKTELNQSDRDDLEHARAAMANVTITSATLHTAGNTTTFSVTLKNQGSSNATIFGLTLHGNFSSSAPPSNRCTQTNSTTSSTSSTSTSSTSTSSTSTSSTSTSTSSTSSHGDEEDHQGQNSTTHSQGQGEEQGQGACNSENRAHDHPDTIPFKVNGTSLVPLFGDGNDHAEAGSASVTLKPGQSITLTFTGVIGIKTDGDQHGQNLIIGAISGNSYTIRLQGEGFQTTQVTAT